MNLSQFPVYSVVQVNQYIKGVMERDELLAGLLVRGEISNYKCYPSGHHYFSLKDAESSIRCVMFRGDATRLRFRPANGMSVVAFGSISVFPRDGQYQLYCKELIDDGRGALDRAFEELRKKLEAEGLFRQAAKQPLPRYPHRIALVTSPAGAAVRDMIRILGTRWPRSEVVVVPVRVQGGGAAEEIAAAIHALNNRSDIDLIITGRGGGSREDLWAFNEEVVARAIFVSNIPVISAVGHEPDVSISDYVADARASTPSNAAEIAVPDCAEQRARIDHLTRRLAAAQQSRLVYVRRKLDAFRSDRLMKFLTAPLNESRMLLDNLQQKMETGLRTKVKDRRAQLGTLCAGLNAMSPLAVMGRGYAIPMKENAVLTSIHQGEAGDRLDIMISDGVLRCEITDKEEKTWL